MNNIYTLIFKRKIQFVKIMCTLIGALSLYTWIDLSFGEEAIKKSSEENKLASGMQVTTPKKYSQMSHEKATRLLKEIVAQSKIPTHTLFRSFGSSWKLPEDKEIDVQGVDISENDWLIVAMARGDSMIMLHNSSGLPEGFPRLNITEGPYKNTSLGPCINNYIFASSVDLALNQELYSLGAGGWTSITPILEKGYYIWLICPGGFLLENTTSSSLLIPFQKPLKGSAKAWFEKVIEDMKADKKFEGPQLYVKVSLSILSGEENGILIDLGEQKIILK